MATVTFGCQSCLLRVYLALLLAVNSGACPVGCECFNNTGGCQLSVVCEQRTSAPPEGLESATDCLKINNPLLAKLSVAEKTSFVAALPVGLRSLDLSKCGLGFGGWVPAFSQFPELLFLNLEFNRLQTLPKETFRGLTKLRVLYLTGNHLDPTDAKEYRKGEILGNRLKQLDPDVFADLTNLRVLMLHHNRLRTRGPDALDGGIFGSQRNNLCVLKLFDQSQGFERSDPPLSLLIKRGCPDGQPSRGDCLQLDTGEDRGDVFEDLMEDKGVTLLEESAFAAWLQEVIAPSTQQARKQDVPAQLDAMHQMPVWSEDTGTAKGEL